MKNTLKTFLSESDREKIRSTVATAEGQTSGEIAPIVAPESYDYPMAGVIGAASISFPAAILFTLIISHVLWTDLQNMWIFIALFCALFIVARFVIERSPGLKRLFISRREMEEEVEEAAIKAFFREGLYRTRDETGVLLFISVFERKVWVLADRGINAKVTQEQWTRIVEHIVSGFQGRRQAEAICEAVMMVSDLLKKHFPPRADDSNELKNLIVLE